MFSIFNKKKKAELSLEEQTGLVIGNWYTQYSAGYWQLIDLKPKYADSDYSGENTSWKKGELIGVWAIVKKAFTAKMKKSIRVECIDSLHLTEVSAEIAAEIRNQFEQDPKYLDKYNGASNTPEPTIINVWLKLTDEQADKMSSKLELLPARFTMEQLEEIMQADIRSAMTNPGGSCNYILNLLTQPWELTEEFDNIYCGAELRKLS